MIGEYQRLPGRGRRIEGVRALVSVPRTTLWLGKDHLLVVDDAGYSETYRRFYFRDIQALIVRKTTAYRTGLVVWGILFALPFAASFAPQERALKVFWWVFAGLLLVGLLVHASKGFTCHVTLHTAVHKEVLPAWKRLRSARRGLERLKPRVLEAQTEAP